jgi:hypothetical protein
MPFESRLHDRLGNIPFRHMPCPSTAMMLMAGSILLMPCVFRNRISMYPSEIELQRKQVPSPDSGVHRFPRTLSAETDLYVCRHTSASQYLVTDDQGTFYYGLFSDYTLYGNLRRIFFCLGPSSLTFSIPPTFMTG